MHRLLVPSEQLASDSPVLPKEAANHLKVLRPKDGEEIELFDGSGKSRRFSVLPCLRRASCVAVAYAFRLRNEGVALGLDDREGD